MSRPPARPGNRLRIIGGRWRGRRLEFPELAGLRPTTDRVRETLFNWLQPVIEGARCLDLFAGSGALGLEAASRGAGRVVLVERERRVVETLRRHCATLDAAQVEVRQADALGWLQGAAEPFDVVFLDPPFRQGLVEPCCRLLERGGWLAPGARVYIEQELEAGAPSLPTGWELSRSKQAGQLGYHLAIRP